MYRINEAGEVDFFVRWRWRRLKAVTYSPNGYTKHSLRVRDKTLQRGTHRLVAEAFLPNPNNCSQVNHKDCNPANNHVSNLEWVTPSQNIRHAVFHGRIRTGEKSPRAKMTDNQVDEIVELSKSGLNDRVIAKQFGVSPALVNLYKRGYRSAIKRDACSSDKTSPPSEIHAVPHAV